MVVIYLPAPESKPRDGGGTLSIKALSIALCHPIYCSRPRFRQLFASHHTALQDPAGGKQAWQAGQAAAALAAHIPVQYCMALPADILASAAYPAVTNARASDDYGAGSAHSWKIGGTSLLLSAVGMKASKGER